MNRSRRLISPVVAVVVGGMLTLLAAAMASMTATDAAELSGIAAGVTLVGLGAGAFVLHALRTRPVGNQIAALTLTTIASLMAGAFAASRAMFISSHDLSILAVVLLAAGTVGVSSALVMGRQLGAASSSLVDVARRVGNESETPRDVDASTRAARARATRARTRRDGGAARRGPPAGENARSLSAGARRLGVARPAHPARRDARDRRSHRRSSRRRPGHDRPLLPNASRGGRSTHRARGRPVRVEPNPGRGAPTSIRAGVARRSRLRRNRGLGADRRRQGRQARRTRDRTTARADGLRT